MRLLAFLFCTSLFGFLPPPYDTVQDVKPFVDFGWHVNGPALRELIVKYRVKRIAEVGVFLGKSTIDMARLLPENGVIYAIDHFLGSEEHQMGERFWHPCMPFLYEQFLSNVIHMGQMHKIVPMRMPSMEAARMLRELPMDLVYIDGAHDTDSVYQDLCAWYPMVKGHGILCGDDWQANTVQEAVLQFAGERGLGVSSSGNLWRIVERREMEEGASKGS